MAQTASDYLIERLYEWGVRRIYGYPGDGINGIMGALNRAQEKIRFIQSRHEELAAFQACAHAKFTGEVTIVKYVVQHGCGVIVNPLVVEGQIHGGVAQGIGGALYETIVYDETGQPLTTTYMDAVGAVGVTRGAARLCLAAERGGLGGARSPPCN